MDELLKAKVMNAIAKTTVIDELASAYLHQTNNKKKIELWIKADIEEIVNAVDKTLTLAGLDAGERL